MIISGSEGQREELSVIWSLWATLMVTGRMEGYRFNASPTFWRAAGFRDHQHMDMAVCEGTQHEVQSLGAPDPNSQGGRECHDDQRNKAKGILEGMCRQHGARKQQTQPPGGVGWKWSIHHQGPEKLRHGRHLQWRRDPSHGQLTCFWALP